MDIHKDWNLIRRHFRNCFKTNLHVSVASVNEKNEPTVTPLGSLFLTRDQKGFYFEKYPSKLPKAAKKNAFVCVLAVNSSKWFWLKSLFKGKFTSHPAIKLYGKLGERRKATDKEISRLARRVKITKGSKGHRYLWKDMEWVREIVFDKAEAINLADMTSDLN